MSELPYVQARHMGAVRGNPTLLVIHSMENAEKDNSAESVANFFRTTDRPASAHICLDNNSAIRCVPDNRVAYAAPGANAVGKQYELAGTARQTKEQWEDPYSTAELLMLVRFLVEDCRKYNIPPIYRTAVDLQQGRMQGITTHHQVSQAFRKSSHWDPGPNFPIANVMYLVRAALNPVANNPTPNTPPQPAPPPPGSPSVEDGLRLLALAIYGTKVEAARNPYKQGDGAGNGRQEGVKIIQMGLQRAGQAVAIDGEFGPITKDHVVWFQTVRSLTADGIVGAQTINSMFP